MESFEVWDRTDARSFYADISCFWRDDARNPAFDAALLRRLADLRLGVSLDIYAASDRDQNDDAL